VTTPDPDVYWPPTLAQLKVDGEIDHNRDDAKLSQELGAAVAYVERVRRGSLEFTGLLTEDEAAALGLVLVDADTRLGTIRLALRWQARGRSPDGMVASPDLGSVRVSTGDSDIDRMLRVGRFAGPVFA
jgi:hypothetical protein